MIYEIDQDFYCSGGDIRSPLGDHLKCWSAPGKCFKNCCCKHRKWPTPEQYKAEYERDVPDDFPVWILLDRGYPHPVWHLIQFASAKHMKEPIVIACTLWGKPENDWRPE